MGKISEASKESYDVILLPTRAHVLAWHKAHAGAQSFGIEVNTPDAWLSSLWELYGSACTLISPLERDMALNAALERLKKDLAAGEAEGVLGRGTQDAQNEKIEQLIQTINCPGFVRLAKNIVKKALGLRELEEALSGNVPENLSEAERAMLCLIKHYCALLDELSLIEPGQAITLLPNRLPEYMHISLLLEGVSNLPEQYKRAFCKSKHFDIEEHEALGEEGIVALGENKNLRFAFPSGRYARPLLLADAISEALETPRARFDAPRVIVACKSPKASFDELTPAFCKHGISAEVKDTRKFSQTDFGKALNISYKLVTPAENSSISADEFIDLLHIPFSEISPQLAREIDAKLRADRLLDVEVAYALSCEQSSVLSLLQEMAQDVQAFLVAGALEDMLYARIHLGEAYISEQIAALNAAKEAMYLASKLSLKMGSCLNVLNETSVNSSASLVLEAGEVEEQIASTQATGKHETASAQTALSTSTPPTTATPTTAPSAPTPPTTAPDVLICTWACASVFAEESCEVLIASNVESDNHSIEEKEDATTAFLHKLHLDFAPDALALARSEFAALCRTCSRELIIERCLYDEKAEPTYPCMVVEEFVDCYRKDLTATEDIDNQFALPALLQENILERGEEHLLENALVEHLGSDARKPACSIDLAQQYEIDEENAPLVLTSSGKAENGESLQNLRLSASQFESYLACPYSWFIERRLKVGPLEEGFGPLQMGEFAHRAFEAFYLKFQKQTGKPKVTRELLPQAKSIMSEILDALEREQFDMNPGSNRLIPLSELEAREVSQLKARLLNFLDFEVELLPHFAPRYFEFDVGKETIVEYAGVQLRGKIDRIDVDDKGRAVIIDYKGSVSEDHRLGSKNETSAPKVQTLIYAQVIRRLLGIDVVGALYVSYGRNPEIAGAIDARVLDSADLPKISFDACACGLDSLSFYEVLDETEKRCKSAARVMCAGKVFPSSASKHTCDYCAHATCEYRR